jgi:hypothetical protein
MSADVAIQIATEFTGKKAFKQAETATEKLNKNVKNLARTFGFAFGTAAVVGYAKKSIKAAADDQKAQQQLALALKNVGLERDAASTEQYINRLETEFGILDDLLRPAYQRLAVATKNSAESQRLLNLALDISASTGKDVNAVTTALSRAYLGNNTALTRLGVGLTKADLKTKSFEEITTQLADTFAGSAAAAASTFSGQLAILTVGAANASEIIGTGLIDALTNLGENTSAAELATNMKNTATYIADVIRGVGTLASKLNDIPILGDFNVGMIPILGSYVEMLREAGKVRQTYNKNEHMARQVQVKSDTKITKLGATQLSNAKKLSATQKQIAAEKKKQEALDMASLVLAQGKKVFDEEGIQLAAAAQSKLTDEEKARVALKKDIYDLEAAINEGNLTAAARLSTSMVANAQKLAALRGDMIGLNDIQNPFTAWLETLRLMALELASLAKIAKTPPKLLGKGSTGAEIEAIIDEYLKLSPEDQTILFGSPLLPKGSLGSTLSGTFTEGPEAARMFNQMSASGGMMAGGTVVNVNVTGSVTTERDLVAAITQGLYSQQASGTPVNYSTVY